MILEEFKSLSLLSRNCFDLLVKIIVVVLSHVIASPDLNFFVVSDHAWRTMFDEVNDTSILKTGHLARYQRSLPWGHRSGRAQSRHYREAI